MSDTDESKPVPPWMLLLFTLAWRHDGGEGGERAKRTSDELLCAAVACGFRQADRLRELCWRTHRVAVATGETDIFTAEAVRLAHAAMDPLGRDAIERALVRAGAADLLHAKL